VKPTVGVPTVEGSTITDSSFTINVTAGDDTSKVASYEYYVGGTKKATKTVGTAAITGLTEGTSYQVYVRVYDNAGLYKDSNTLTVELMAKAPVITIANKDTWTKTKQVTIAAKAGFTIRYTTDGSSPTATSGTVYNGAFTINKNCTIKAVYVSSTNKVGKIGSQSTNKIDGTAPSTATLTKGTVNTTSIAVTGAGADGQSGVKSYTFQLSTTSTTAGFSTKSTTNSTAGTCNYTYTGLAQGTVYYLRVIVTDNAGNQKTSNVVTVDTQATAPTITIANKDIWTKNKQVTIATKSGYTIRYTTNGTNPTATSGTVYNGAFTITANCTVKAVYISNTNSVGIVGSQATSKVDTADPSAGITTGTINTTSIAVTASGSDTQSGVKSYTFQRSTDGNNYTTVKTTNSTASSCTYTYTGLAQYTTYYVRVIVTDNAGRQKTSSAKSAKTYHAMTYCSGPQRTPCVTCRRNRKCNTFKMFSCKLYNAKICW